jgi:hypothetical protein
VTLHDRVLRKHGKEAGFLLPPSVVFLWPILRFGLSENFEMDLGFAFGNHRF